MSDIVDELKMFASYSRYYSLDDNKLENMVRKAAKEIVELRKKIEILEQD